MTKSPMSLFAVTTLAAIALTGGCTDAVSDDSTSEAAAIEESAPSFERSQAKKIANVSPTEAFDLRALLRKGSLKTCSYRVSLNASAPSKNAKLEVLVDGAPVISTGEPLEAGGTVWVFRTPDADGSADISPAYSNVFKEEPKTIALKASGVTEPIETQIAFQLACGGELKTVVVPVNQVFDKAEVPVTVSVPGLEGCAQVGIAAGTLDKAAMPVGATGNVRGASVTVTPGNSQFMNLSSGPFSTELTPVLYADPYVQPNVGKALAGNLFHLTVVMQAALWPASVSVTPSKYSGPYDAPIVPQLTSLSIPAYCPLAPKAK